MFGGCTPWPCTDIMGGTARPARAALVPFVAETRSQLYARPQGSVRNRVRPSSPDGASDRWYNHLKIQAEGRQLMRLPADRVREAILHPDKEVREAAAHYFAGAYSPDTAVMPLVIRAIERHGFDHAFGSYTFMDDLAQTDE